MTSTSRTSSSSRKYKRGGRPSRRSGRPSRRSGRPRRRRTAHRLRGRPRLSGQISMVPLPIYNIPSPSQSPNYMNIQPAYANTLQYSPSSPVGPPITMADLETYGAPIDEQSPTGVADLNMSR